MTALRFSLLLLSSTALLGACAVGPDYRRPKVEAAPDYKEVADWQPTEPQDVLKGSPWWTIFKDDALNNLEAKIDISNQNVKAAVASVDQARALVREARASFFPQVSVTAGVQRGSTDGGPTINSKSVGATGSWVMFQDHPVPEPTTSATMDVMYSTGSFATEAPSGVPLEGGSSWRVMDWVVDWELVTTNVLSPTGGTLGMLDLIGRERKLPRLAGEPGLAASRDPAAVAPRQREPEPRRAHGLLPVAAQQPR